MTRKSNLKKNAYSFYNMGLIHIDKGNFSRGKDFLLKAVNLDKRDPELKHALGVALINDILTSRMDHFYLTDADNNQLKLADDYLTKAIRRLEGTERKRQLASALLHRSIARAILHQHSAALSDINRLISLDANDFRAFDQRAKILLMSNNPSEAIKDYETAIKKGGPKDSIIPSVVSAFTESSQPMPEEAIRFLAKYYNKQELTECLVPKTMLAMCFAVKGDFTKSRILIEELYQKFGRVNVVLSAQAMLEKRAKNAEKYEELLKEIIESGVGVQKVLATVDLAQHYRNSGNFAEAIPLYEKLLVSGRLDNALKDYIACLYNAQDNRASNIEKCLRIINEFQNRYPKDTFLLEMKALILEELHKIDEAAQVLRKLVDLDRSNYRHKVHYAVDLVQIGGEGNIVKARKILFGVIEKILTDKKSLELYVKIMGRIGEQEEAIRRAYQLVSLDSSNANFQTLYTSLFLRREEMKFLESQEVKEDFYVKFDDNGQEKTYLVTGDPGADITKNEVYKLSSFGRAIYGKRVGDVCEIKGKMRPERLKILEIRSKYIKLFQDIMENFNKLFPESKDLIKMEGGSKAFLEEAEKLIKTRSEHVDKVMDLYLSKRCTIGLLASLLQVDIYMAWLGLVQGKTKLYCASGKSEDQQDELKAVLNSKEILVDPVALFTLNSLDLLDALFIQFEKVYIPRAFVNALSEIIYDMKMYSGKNTGALFYKDGKLAMTETTAEESAAHLKFLLRIEELIDKKLFPVGFEKVSDKEAEQRKKVLGETHAAIVQICQERGMALFSDDLLFRIVSKSLINDFVSFSIQPLLVGMSNRGVIKENQYCDKIISLARLGYDYLSLSAPILLHSITNNYLQVSYLKDFDNLLGILMDKRTTPSSALNVISGLIKLIYIENMPSEIRISVLEKSLDALAAKIGPKFVARALNQNLPRSLGLVDFLMPRISKDIAQWLKSRIII